MADDPIPVTPTVSIPQDEVELRFSRSSGPGGQHAQKSDTRVEAVFDVEASSTLTDAQKRRGGAETGGGVRAGAAGEGRPWGDPGAAPQRVAGNPRPALPTERPPPPAQPPPPP